VDYDTFISGFNISSRTPILENIYDTIASEFSKIDLILSRIWTEYETPDPDEEPEEYEGNKGKIHYQQLINHKNAKPLMIRPNKYQNPSEMMYTIAYQLFSYGNALVKIIREAGERNTVLELETINADDYLFGEGFTISDYIQEKTFLNLIHKKTGQLVTLDYDDTIHLRLNPNDVFYGDRNKGYDLTNFIKIFDENLSAMLNDLQNSGKVKGVIEIGGSYADGGFNAAYMDDEAKISKQDEILKRIKATRGGLLVLDTGEKFRPLPRAIETMGMTDVTTFMALLYSFKGINPAVIEGTATEAEMEVFFNKTLMPPLERLIEELNYKYLTANARTRGHVIEYFKNPFEFMSMKDLLPMLYNAAIYFTKNEVRRLAFKMTPLEGGDELQDNKNFRSRESTSTPTQSTTSLAEGTTELAESEGEENGSETS